MNEVVMGASDSQPQNQNDGPRKTGRAAASEKKSAAKPARLSRLLRIIETLQSGRFYNSQELATLCEVSRRTVFRDIASLQQAGLQVRQDDAKQGYYLPHRLAFPPSELSLAESFSLWLLCQELGGTDGGIPFQAAASSAAEKICRSLPPHVRDMLHEMTEMVSIGLDAHHPLTSSQGHYEMLLRAMLERRQLRIDYLAASEEGRLVTTLDPYRVIFRRRGW